MFSFRGLEGMASAGTNSADPGGDPPTSPSVNRDRLNENGETVSPVSKMLWYRQQADSSCIMFIKNGPNLVSSI